MKASLFGWESPRPAAIIRIGLGLVLLWDALPRWPDIVELYSTAGMTMPLFPGTLFEPTALSARTAVVLYALLLFSLATVALGWQTRISLLLAFVLSVWFGLLDFAGTFKKYSVISLHLLLLLEFTQSHSIWSIDAWIHRNRRRLQLLSANWPRFLMRVLVSSIYLGAVVTKLRLPDFANGDLLMFSLLDDRWGGTRLGMWLTTQPRLLVLVSFATVLFELAAALLLWVPQFRRLVLLLAIGFQLAIGVAMHVGIFSPMMFVALTAFLHESDLQSMTRPLRRLFRQSSAEGIGLLDTVHSRNRRRSIASLLAFAITAGLCATMGFVYQQTTGGPDPFGDLGQNQWKTIDQKTFDEMVISEKPIPEDFFHRIEIGSRLGYRQLFGERENFPRGSTIYVMARMAVQRKQPLELQWVLTNAAEKELQRHSSKLNPVYTYVWFAFDTSRPKLPAGEYRIVLEAEGKVVFRKRFRIVD